MKLKGILLTGLSFVLVAAVAIGGTLAYLTSKDSDVNVMTLGDVSIEQHEYQRVVNADGTYATATIDNQTSYVLEKFAQAKPLLPIVGDPSLPGDNPEYAGYDDTVVRMSQVDSYGSAWVFAGKNAQDKLVTIENTGKTDAYVRTLIAYECGSINTVDDFNELVSTSEFMTNSGEVWTKSTIGIIEIDSNNYVVVEFIYNGGKHLGGVHEKGVLPAGETSYPSLCQVYIKSNATNEDCEALDGNKNGTYDILVLSQAVQAEGFANAETALYTAFGKSADKAAEWFGGDEFENPAVVREAGALNAALEDGKTIYFADDISAPVEKSAIYGTPTAVVQKNSGVIDGNGNELIVESNAYNAYAMETWGGTIKNLSIKTALGRGIVISSPKSDIYISNVIVDGPGYAINTTEHNGKNLVVSNSTFNGWSSLAGLDSATFNNCSFGENTAKYWQNMGYDKDYDRLIRPYISTEFNSCEFEQDFYIDLSALGADCKVTLDNCTTNGTKITASNYASCIFIELPSGRSLTDCVIFK